MGWMSERMRKRIGKFDDKEGSELGCDVRSSEDRLDIGTDDS